MMSQDNFGYEADRPVTIKTLLFRAVVTVLVFAAYFLLAGTVYANSDDRPDLNATTHGSVWLLPSDGVYLEALQLETRVNMDVSGMIARAKVRQQFRNVSSLWAEGIYVFPLPDNAAVDHFRMMIDERIIEGQIQEKNQARKTYQAARRNGQQTGLVEQQRSNIFTTRLANIAPGAVMTVEIEYQQTLAYRDGYYQLRYPMVVGERYITASREGATDPQYDTGVYTETSTTSNTLNPVSISINMDTGIPIKNIVSASHPVEIRPQEGNAYIVSLRDNHVPADRDFVLKWEPQLAELPRAAVFNQQHEGYEYSLVTLYPPENDLYNPLNIPREVVFILDVSGSMAGTSIEQAQSALKLALDRLIPSDKFNVIWFNNQAKKLYASSQLASEHRIDYAKQFVGALEANGGTEMLPALRLALGMRAEPEYLRQVVFLTDGNVSNERDLFSYIKSGLGNSRLFTVGIGSAPNGFFMKRAAQAGRGTYTFIGDINEVADKSDELFRKLETPALTDVELSLGGDELEYYKNPIPDMYIGEPVSILLRGKNMSSSIMLKGNIGAQPWQQTVSLTQGIKKEGIQNEGISTAWAREKIASLSESYHDAGNEALKTLYKQQVIDVSRAHHLVSQYTSLVAVDVTPVNQGGMLYQERLKNNLPHGWAARGQNKQGDKTMLAQINLPRTATDAPLHIMFAMVFLALGMMLRLTRKMR